MTEKITVDEETLKRAEFIIRERKMRSTSELVKELVDEEYAKSKRRTSQIRRIAVTSP